MAIKKGIEPGDTLWVDSRIVPARTISTYGTRREQPAYTEYTRYYLVSRRARVNGVSIKKEQVGFFRYLGIKISEQTVSNDIHYFAVGVEREILRNPSTQFTPHLPTHVEEHYAKVPNHFLLTLLDSPELLYLSVNRLKENKVEPLDVDAVLVTGEDFGLPLEDRYYLRQYSHEY